MGSHGKPLGSLSRWFLYAIHGYFSEVMFTASWDFIRTQDWTLRGVTSVWALFIYGTGILGLEQLHRGLDGRWPLLARGCLYTACIYLWEFVTGALLRRFGACPWDYSHFRYNVMGLVTLEYSPFWFLGSLVLERLVIRNILRLRLDRAPQPRGQPHARLAWKDD